VGFPLQRQLPVTLQISNDNGVFYTQLVDPQRTNNISLYSFDVDNKNIRLTLTADNQTQLDLKFNDFPDNCNYVYLMVRCSIQQEMFLPTRNTYICLISNINTLIIRQVH